ncbi:MAG: glycosyltransferase [Thermoanaerobaculia bacterium]|nr:glycosyltransferase [Thermoanaerobaculia bacterium]
MRIAYHFTVPRPPRPELDGAVQEALWLSRRFGGSIHYHYPGRRHLRLLPRALCGVRNIRETGRLDLAADLHHLFVARPVWLPILWRWRRPLVVTVLAPPHEPPGPRSLRWPPGLRRIVVPTAAAEERLRSLGVEGARWVPPAVDPDRVGRRTAPPPAAPLRLLAGSAPWNHRQMLTKGYASLLGILATDPRWALTILWRGTSSAGFRAAVERLGLNERVEILEKTVDVREVVARCHAAVVLEAKPGLVKGFPQSLLEALAAGRPVIASSSLAIAGLCRERGCGVVVQEVARRSLREGLQRLHDRYDELRRAALRIDPGELSLERFLTDYGDVYSELLEHR